MILPPEAIPLLTAAAPAFTQPTYRRFATLLIATVLTTGRRTVANLLRTLGGLAKAIAPTTSGTSPAPPGRPSISPVPWRLHPPAPRPRGHRRPDR